MRLSLKNFFKKNYELFCCYVLFAIILIVAFNPAPYISATYSGIVVWAKIVLPSLFCFFILTKIFMQFHTSSLFSLALNKPFSKLYNIKNYGGYVFILSIISGYPIGAKLISDFHANGLISNSEAKRFIPFCSTSGAMFIIGSVATQMFYNYRLGIILYIVHIFSALINGLFYRKIGLNTIETKQTTSKIKSTKQTLNEIMFDTIISVLMIGGYIAICFTMLELANNFKIFTFLNKIFNCNFFDSILKGIIEVTNGCVSLGKANLNIKTSCVILSMLLSFGGLSIHLQSQIFLSKIGIKYKYFLLTKITQTIISFVLSLIFSILFL